MALQLRLNLPHDSGSTLAVSIAGAWRCFLQQSHHRRHRPIRNPLSQNTLPYGTALRPLSPGAASVKNLVSNREPALYHEFVDFALHEAAQHAHLLPFPMHEQLKEVLAFDGKTILHSHAFDSSKMRLLRITTINGGDAMQVMNMAVFPKPEFDLPIFCADFFSSNNKHIIVLDLNPLYDTEKNKNYKKKYYSDLMPLVNKYIEVLPWGQKITTESLHFFSPIVIWTKLETRRQVQESVFSAFKDYLQAWFSLHDKAEATLDPSQISTNQKAQHRYLLWRATKDPGRPLLHRLFGEDWCEKYIDDFLFNGVQSMGSEGFLDHFPEYKCPDGSINKNRSIIGKTCTYRPWDKEGNFLVKVEKA